MHRFVRALVSACFTGIVISACVPADAPAKGRAAAASKATPITAVSEADTCARLDTGARLQRSTEAGPLPPPRNGSWTATRRVALDAFSLEIPVVARARPRDAHDTYWVDSLPGCRFFCALEVTFIRDSTTASLDSYITARRMVDTTSNPDAADWIPGPPRFVSFGGRPAAIMETACGDCTSGEVLFFKAGQVAELKYSLDDREGFQPGLVCRLQRMAGTFEWGAPGP